MIIDVISQMSQVIPHRHVGGARPLRGASGAEGQIGLRLQHPHVICTYKFATFDHSARFPHANPSKRARSQEGLVPRNFPGQGDGLHSWIVLEYCNYGTLQSVIDKGMLRTDNSTWKGGPDMRVVLTVAHDVASAMAYLHEQVCVCCAAACLVKKPPALQGVLHGDLGPKNVLLVRDDMRSPPFIAKVSDFGLAHELAVDASLVTHTYGTVTHMPVELVCNGTLTAAVDVYAFGVMLWELYTGTELWGIGATASNTFDFLTKLVSHYLSYRSASVCWLQSCAACGAKADGWTAAYI